MIAAGEDRQISEQLNKLFMYIVYNILQPELNKSFVESDKATNHMFACGDEYDVTDSDSFRNWFPNVKVN